MPNVKPARTALAEGHALLMAAINDEAFDALKGPESANALIRPLSEYVGVPQRPVVA